MNKEMTLKIQNFGPIKEANIDLNKLNVIAGINGSGKSTSSKLLFCFLNGTSNEGIYLANNSIYQRLTNFIYYWHYKLSSKKINPEKLEPLLNILNTQIPLTDDSFNKIIKNKINKIKEIIDKIDFQEKTNFYNEINNIEEILNMNENETIRYFNVTNSLLNSEFKFSEINYFNSKVKFFGNINECPFKFNINFKKDRIGAEINESYLNCLNFKNIIYIDSASLFDFNNPNNTTYHLKSLKNKINVHKNLDDVYDNEFNKNMDNINNKIVKIIGGTIYFDFEKNDFIFKKEDGTYSMQNTASGIKQIGIIQILLNNRCLKKDSFLFIDEPELNLHPEWQIKFAEIIALLVKELNIYMYINSHSPQFIEAISLFSQKYDLLYNTNMFLTEENNNKTTFKQIDPRNMGAVYENLNRPFDDLDKIKLEILQQKIDNYE